MPELPDIQVFTTNLKLLLAGKRLLKIKIVNGKKLKDKQADLSKSLNNTTVKDIYRSGKEMRFKFSNNRILGIHLMLTGDIIPFEKINERKSTISELYFSGGKNLALTDRMGNAYIKLDPQDKAGIDALDRGLDFKYLKSVFEKRKANIKNLLLDQNIIRGIGNSYSDEILWQCKISPFSIVNKIPDEKIKELVKTIKSVLKKEIIQINKTHPGLIHGEVKEFLKIHTKQKTVSPTGVKIKIVDRGMLKTYYTNEQKIYK